MIEDIVKVFIPSLLSFLIGIAVTPGLTHYLYKNEMWKKKSGKVALDGSSTPIFNELHKNKEVGTPKLGGSIIWISSALAIIVLSILAYFFPTSLTGKLNFLSRNQTWIPLATLIVGALVGLIDDLLEIAGSRDHISGGLSLKKRLLIVFLIGIACGLWFHFKLDINSIGIPKIGDVFIGWLIIPLTALVMLAVYTGGVIDGLDGLAGGIFAAIFTAYAGIAFYQQQIDLAAFCALIVGGILAFLWFNIPPARFYMSETGTMSLTVTLTVVAFMTDSLGEGHGLIVLPIVAMPLVITSLSVVIQLLSKKFRNGKKVFMVAPIHHHFEAMGWPSYKVTMRFWIIGVVFAILGLILGLIG
jgi:phospho-N-acetylmuramoyl-pentapeptide-transferase